MKSSHLLVLVVVAAVLIGLAAWSSKSRRAAPPPDIGKPVLPELNVNAVRRIELRQGDQAVVVTSTDNGWTVTNLYGFPADFKKVSQNLLALRDLKVADVEPGMTFAEPETVRVDLKDERDGTLAFLRLGPKRQRKPAGDEGWSMPDGRYVSSGGASAYLVKDTLESFDLNAKDWVNTELFNVPAADIAAIDLVAPDGKTLKFDRSSGALKLEGLGETEELDSSKVYGLEAAMSYLRFTDVANPALTADVMGFATAHVYRVSLKTGESYTAHVGGKAADGAGTDRYMRFDVSLAPATTNDAARAELEKKVADLKETLSRWTFLVSNYTADNMTAARSDLVKTKTVQTNAVEQAPEPK